jgi:DHA3 family macrolide efflux protein-like MFS transporter
MNTDRKRNMFIQGFFLLGNKVLIEAGEPAAVAGPEAGHAGGSE